MKKELNPAVFWAVIGVVVIGAIIIGYKVLAPRGFTPETKGSEDTMKKVQSGGKMYEPPTGMFKPPESGSGPGNVPAGAPGSAPTSPSSGN